MASLTASGGVYPTATEQTRQPVRAAGLGPWDRALGREETVTV